MNKSANRGTTNVQSCAKPINIDGIDFYPTKYLGYFVSKSGKIISFRRAIRNQADTVDFSKPPKYLKYGFGSNRKRYYRVIIMKNKERIPVLVHRLVYETFNGEIPKTLTVDHIDGNIYNNSLDNLQLLTIEDNIRKSNKGKICPFRKKVIVTKDGITKEFDSISKAIDNSLGKRFIDFETIKRARNSVSFPAKAIRGTGYTIEYFKESPETIEIILSTYFGRRRK